MDTYAIVMCERFIVSYCAFDHILRSINLILPLEEVANLVQK